MKRRVFVFLGLTLVMIAVAILAFFLGDRHAMSSISIKRATATHIANAMKDDRFFADYGHSTLLVHGIVSSMSVRGSNLIVELKTDSSFQVFCGLATHVSNLRSGDQITVITEGYAAERHSSAVFLRDRVIPSAP